MPDMPAHRHRGFDRLHGLVERGVSLAQAVREEHFPGGQLGIAQQNSPELDEVSVRGALAATCRANEFFELEKPLPCAISADAALCSLFQTKFAEAGYVARINGRRI